MPKSFEAIVNQEIRIVGTKGIWEVDSQYRGSRSCIEDEGMRTYNNSFMREMKDKQNRTIYRGYGIESIEDFAYNVQAIKNGASIESLKGTYPDGEDGLEVTKIGVAVHKSLETGGSCGALTKGSYQLLLHLPNAGKSQSAVWANLPFLRDIISTQEALWAAWRPESPAISEKSSVYIGILIICLRNAQLYAMLLKRVRRGVNVR